MELQQKPKQQFYLNSARMLQKKPDYTAKIVIIGNTNVGKTQLASSICNKQLNNNSTTIGTDILKHLITTQTNESIMLHFWDTAGQQRYRNIANMYMKGVDAVIFVFSVVDSKSYQDMRMWMKELDIGKIQSAVIAVVGNKLDLDQGYLWTKQQLQDIQNLREQYNPADIKQFAVSAKTRQNVEQLKKWLIKKISKKMRQKNPLGDRPIYLSVANSSFLGDGSKKNRDNNSGCC